MNGCYKYAQTLLCSVQGIALILFFALTFIVDSGYSYGAVLLVLCGIAALFLSNRERLSPYCRRWLWVLCVAIALMLVVRLVHDEPLNEYDKVSRYLLSIPLLFGFTRYRPSLKIYIAGVCIACILALLAVIISKAVYGLPYRALFFPISNFSRFSMIMAIAALFATLALRASSIWYLLTLVCAISAMVASFLSGGRGGWIMLPPAVLLFLFAMRRQIGLKWRITGLSGCVALITILYLVPQTHVAQRVQSVFSDIRNYQEGRIATSNGMRLEMWRFGFYLIGQKPVLGSGGAGMMTEKKKLAEAGKFDHSIEQFNQLHNDYIDVTARYGIVGLAQLLLLYCAPLVICLRRLRDTMVTTEEKMFSYSSIAVAFCFIISSLTEVFMRHNISNIFYPVIQIWLISGIMRRHRGRIIMFSPSPTVVP